MSGTTAPASNSVTFHVGRAEDVPLVFTLAGAPASPVAGGTLAVADTAIATGALSADDSMAKFTGVAVGTTTATFSDASGGGTFSAEITLVVIADPAADGVTFNAGAATEEPAASTATAAPVTTAPAAS